MNFTKPFLNTFVSKSIRWCVKTEKNWTLQKPFAIMRFVIVAVSKSILFDTAFYMQRTGPLATTGFTSYSKGTCFYLYVIFPQAAVKG